MREHTRSLGSWIAVAALAVGLAGCTIGGTCVEGAAPTCASDRVMSRCVAGQLREIACAPDEVCSDTIGCSQCAPGALECTDDHRRLLVCASDGASFEAQPCPVGETCVAGTGCRACAPGTTLCDGETLLACRDDGSGHDVLEACDSAAGRVCRDGLDRCVDAASLCELVEADRTNLGCDFWAAPLAACGSPLDTSFALLIANPYPVATSVTFERAGETVHPPQTIGALGSQVVHLPCVPTPRETGIYTYSALRRSGAYRVRASTPISLVQVQPTEDPTVVPDDFVRLGDGALVMPARSLACSRAQPCELYAMSMTTWLSHQGSLAIVGTDDRPVTVTVRLSAPIAPSVDGFTGRPETIPLAFEGEELQLTLGPGDVVELMTSVPASGFFYDLFYDLTGTRVIADGRVAVLSGSEIAFVPLGASGPSSLSESMPPVSTWGTVHVVARPRAIAGEPFVVKVLAAEDDTDVSFEPELYPARRLRAGESFELFADDDVVVRSSRPVLVAMLTVSRSLYEPSEEAEGRGGPAMALVPSIERGVVDASFAVMPSVASGLSIGAPEDAEITLDGRRVGLRAIGSSGFAASRLTLGAGVHRLRSTTPIVAWLHGVGSNGAFLVPVANTLPAGLE